MDRRLNDALGNGNTVTPKSLKVFNRTQGKGRIKSLYIESLKVGLTVYFIIDDIVTSIGLHRSSKFTCPLVYTDDIYATSSNGNNTKFSYARNWNISNNKVDEYFIIQDNSSDTIKAMSNIEFHYGSNNLFVPPADGVKILLPEAITFEKSFILMIANTSTADIQVNVTIIYDYDDFIAGSSS